jgi:bacillithiol system protein YtxJ
MHRRVGKKKRKIYLRILEPVYLLLLLLSFPACGKDQKMGDIFLLKSNADFEKVIAQSQTTPLFLFKHSTSCPISAQAFHEFQSFVATKPEGLIFAMVRVIEERPVSQEIATRLAVKHESPQLILIHQGKVLWYDSHWRITQAKIAEVVKNRLAKK